MLHIRSSTLFILLAIAVTAQLGYVGHRERGRAGTLRAELEQMRASTEESIAELTQQLETARSESSQLRTALDQERLDLDHLEGDLSEARIAAWLLEGRVGLLRDTLVDDPPYLEVSLAPTDPPGAIEVTAANVGGSPIEIGWARGMLFSGSDPQDAGTLIEALDLQPGEVADFYRFEVSESPLAHVSAGGPPIRGALCFVFSRSLGTDPPEWLTEYWFEYQPASGSVAVLAHTMDELSDDSACTLESATPPWS